MNNQTNEMKNDVRLRVKELKEQQRAMKTSLSLLEADKETNENIWVAWASLHSALERLSFAITQLGG